MKVETLEKHERRKVDVQLYEARTVPAERALSTVREADIELPAAIRGVQGGLAHVQAAGHLRRTRKSDHFMCSYKRFA